MPTERKISEYSPLVHRDIRFYSKNNSWYYTALQRKQKTSVGYVLSKLSQEERNKIVEIVGNYTGYYEVTDSYIDQRLNDLCESGEMSEEERTEFLLLLSKVERRIALLMGYTEYHKEMTRHGKESSEERI